MAREGGTTEMTTTELVRRSLVGGGVNLRSLAFEGVLAVTLLVALGVLAWLLVVIAIGGLPVFFERGFDFLTSDLSSNPDRAGVAQGIVGSLMLMGFVVIVSFPLGIGAAIYLEEYARDTWGTRLINTIVRNLAGVPSIVYGLLGLAVFVVALRELTGPGNAQGQSLVSGGLTMAILVLPIVIITAAEALRAVPTSIREAGFGVGATRWEVVRSHVVPYAAPGILTGTILAVARAFGETAPLIMVGAVVGGLSTSYEGAIETIQGRYTALPTTVYDWARKPADFAANTYAAIMVLLVVLLAINALAIVLRNRLERRW